MTASGLILPGRASRRVGRVANAMLLWRANDLDVVPVTEQAATFIRGGLSTPLDDRGVLWTASNYAPAWSMVSGRGSLLMTTADTLNWPILFQPPAVGEAMTMLVELDPVWARTGGVAGTPGVAYVGGTATASADDRVMWNIVRSPGFAQVVVYLYVGVTAAQVPLAIPASGTLQVLTQLRPNGANHDLYAELNGVNGTVTGNVVAGKLWKANTAGLNAAPSAATGTGRYMRMAVARGQRTLAEMLAL